MRTGNKQNIYSFMIEISLSLLTFALAMVFCLRLFSASASINHANMITTKLSEQMISYSELLRNGESSELIESLSSAEVQNNSGKQTISVYFDADGEPSNSEKVYMILINSETTDLIGGSMTLSSLSLVNLNFNKDIMTWQVSNYLRESAQ